MIGIIFSKEKKKAEQYFEGVSSFIKNCSAFLFERNDNWILQRLFLANRNHRPKFLYQQCSHDEQHQHRGHDDEIGHGELGPQGAPERDAF